MDQPGRLRWRCRRGAKELDTLLTAYLDRAYASAPRPHQQAFEQLLAMQDPDLLALLLGIETTDDPLVADVIERIRQTADD